MRHIQNYKILRDSFELALRKKSRLLNVMPTGKDPRRIIGAAVHAKATAVTSLAECSRLFGSNANSKLVNGEVLNVETTKIKGRLSTSLTVKWVLLDAEISKIVTKTLKLINVKAGHVSNPAGGESTAASKEGVKSTEGAYSSKNNSLSFKHADLNHFHPATNPSVSVHGTDWYEMKATCPIGGHIPRTFWTVRGLNGDTLHEGACYRNRKPFDCFMDMFPQRHLVAITYMTSNSLAQLNKPETTVSEILKFFGILILMTRFEFGRKADLWSLSSRRKYIPAPAFGRTGMSKQRFFDIISCIKFSNQPAEKGDLSSVQYRWLLVQDFVDAINAHRQCMVQPSDLICVDESISRWYGLGGHWIDIGLPHYVAIDRKPENGCEIQNAACGRSGIMLRVELVSTAEEESTRHCCALSFSAALGWLSSYCLC